MVAISIMIEGQMGLNWPRWQRLVAEVEALGFAGLFRSDHFTDPQPPDQDALDLIVSLTYAADHSRRIHFGSLVAPFSFRDPVMLARQAAALDALSEGRMILGVGAGWQEREHHAFGYELGDLETRMARFQEGLEVVTRLTRGAGPATFEGRFYHLRDAAIRPRPHSPRGLTLLVGGNGRTRTLPLAARYADGWNGVFLSPADYQSRSALLDGLLREAGRQPADVRRTMMTGLAFGRDVAELDRVLGWRHANPTYASLPLEQVVAAMHEKQHMVAGTPDAVVGQIGAYAAAGVEELMLQWLDLDDVDRLRAFAGSVLPRLG